MMNDNSLMRTPVRSLTVSALGVVVRVETACDHLLACIETVFSEYITPVGRADDTDQITRPVIVQIEPKGDVYRVSMEGRTALLPFPDKWPRIDDLVQMIIERERSDLFFVHSSAVEIGGRAAILIGPSTHGKTTLALALQERGGVMLAEDTSPIDSASGTVLSFRTGVRLRAHTHEIAKQQGWRCAYSRPLDHNAAIPIDRMFFLMHDPAGSTVRVSGEHSLAEWDSMRDLCYKTAVAPNPKRTTCYRLYQPEAFQRPPSLRPILPSDAMRRFLSLSHWADRPLHVQLSATANLFSQVPCFELQTGHLEAMVDLVLNELHQSPAETVTQ